VISKFAFRILNNQPNFTIMKRIITFLAGLITFFASATLSAQQKTDNRDKSLLWRISGKQLTKPSYLFGTMHLICPNDYIWTDKMKKSLTESEKVCFEFNLNDPSVMTQVANGLIDNSGKKLQDYFTPEQYNLVKKYLKDSLGTEISFYEHMKPVVLQSIMAVSGSGCPNPISYEDSIMKTALRAKKEITGLEELQEEIDLLVNIPADSVVSEIMDQVQKKGNSDSELHLLLTAYKNQDLPALNTLINSSRDLNDEMGMFLDDRNKKWISRIAGKMQQSSVFFAVGAGHLWGENGVIALLRKQGYKVDPVK
jgi:uncharacterized protein YbaP (TraB family)